jgi:hypothetical protein
MKQFCIKSKTSPIYKVFRNRDYSHYSVLNPKLHWRIKYDQPATGLSAKRLVPEFDDQIYKSVFLSEFADNKRK